LKAKRNFSSSEEDLPKDKENNIRQDKNLPAFPQKEYFISNKKQLFSTPAQNMKNTLCENISFNAVNRNGKY